MFTLGYAIITIFEIYEIAVYFFLRQEFELYFHVYTINIMLLKKSKLDIQL